MRKIDESKDIISLEKTTLMLYFLLNDEEAFIEVLLRFALCILSHLVKTAIKQPVHLRLVKGQFLHLSPVVKTEVNQTLGSSCVKTQIQRLIFTFISHIMFCKS